MNIREPAVSTEARRSLFSDPEFPFWTTEPQRGHVVMCEGKLSVIFDIKEVGTQTWAMARILNPDGTDFLGNGTGMIVTKDSRGDKPPGRVKVFDRMYFHGENKPYQIDLIDYEPLMNNGGNRTDHSDKLSPDNPLRMLPYWGGAGGKNLTIVACLEWALTHLEFENNKLPCLENEKSIWNLREAIALQKHRQKTRQEQGVIGTNQPHKSVPL